MLRKDNLCSSSPLDVSLVNSMAVDDHIRCDRCYGKPSKRTRDKLEAD